MAVGSTGNRRLAAVGAGLLLAYAMLLLAGALGQVWLFAVAATGAATGEVIARRTGRLLEGLARVGIQPTHRHVARDVALLLLLVVGRPGGMPATAVALVAGLMATVWALGLVAGAARAVVAHAWMPAVLTRGLELPRNLRRRLPRPVSWFGGESAAYLNWSVVPGAVVSVGLDVWSPAVVAATVAAALAAVVAVAVAAWCWRLRGAPGRAVLLRAVREQVRPDPQVVLYFAGSRADAYQVSMWLSVVAALPQPALVVLRDPGCFRALPPSDLPVVCVPGAVDLMNFGFDSVRVALYPSNTGPNIHLLREPGMKHVFVGHGDSDKIASVNPYSKVYDEVWVAGRAGRDRYALADVGVRDEDIVEVGRPQLAGLATTGSPPDTPFTVLYAPTWEGWVEDPHATSLLLLGEKIIAGLLAISPAVRVWYKPHPLTGKRSQAAAATHARLAHLVAAAGGTVGATAAETLPALSHHVFSGAQPALFDCFNQADLLISDVSSVVSDWIVTRKPYAVGNTRDLPADEFRRSYPTAGAAYLLSSSGAELATTVALCRDGADPQASARAELKAYLLGPDEPSSAERFQAEMTRLCAHRRSPAVTRQV